VATCDTGFTTWIDEATEVTATQLNALYNTPLYSYTPQEWTTTTATYDHNTYTNGITICTAPEEPEPEPVFENLGDFLLHKYNKVKEVQVA
jgi:hypothetical protein